MSAAPFTLSIVTPLHSSSREVSFLRLSERAGSFGIFRGHADMVALLVPVVGYCRDPEGGERFLAAEGGVFTMRDGAAVITARELFESDDPAALGELIDSAFARRDAAELAVAGMIQALERSFLQKNAALARGER